MNSIMLTILIFLVIALVVCINKLIDYSRHKSFRELIAWCVTSNSKTHRCNLSLRDYIHNAQLHLNIPKEYRICQEDWDYANEIIEQYRRDLIEDYFTGCAYLLKSKYVISGEEYFMFSISNYLEEHQCDFQFSSHDMHKETISFKSYGSWGGPLYDAEYALTDFAIVYHKLYYISLLYCQSNDVINPKKKEYSVCAAVKEILDKKTIQMSRS